MDVRRRTLSLVPYSSDSRQIILRHQGNVVVLDEQSRQLSVRPDSTAGAVELVGKCPTCRRPLQNEAGQPDEPMSPHWGPAYMNPEYFNLLHHSSPPSDTSSRQPSPERHLLQAANSGVNTPNQEPVRHATLEDEDEPATKPHRISVSALSPGYFKRFFREEGILGKGGNGVVLLVRHFLDSVDMGLFACKRVPVGDDHDWLKKVLAEVQLLQRLQHRNIVAYRHVWLEETQFSTFGPPVPCAFMLQQYCNGGDLHRYVLGNLKSVTKEQLKDRVRSRSKAQLDVPLGLVPPRRMAFDEILSFFTDITAGLNYLHRENLIHRDLKPSNCLLHTEGRHTTVLVSDFGEVQGEGTVRKSTGNTGTISYCAPEVLRKIATGAAFQNFSYKSDVFSLGMIVHFMCFGRLPYSHADEINEENEDLDQLKEEITAWIGLDDDRKERKDLPDRLYAFLKRLLSLDPEERPSTDEILQTIMNQAASEEHNHYPAGPSPRNPDDSSLRSGKMSPSSPSATPADYHNPSISNARSANFASKSSSPVQERSMSFPMQRSSSGQGESGVILRKRSPRAATFATPERSPHGPRLLPAPPRSRIRAILDIAERPQILAVGRLLLFCLKFWSIYGPCSPYAANTYIAYPLLVLGGLDLAGLASGLLGSGLLMLLHFVAVAAMVRYSALCASDWNSYKWNDVRS